MEEVSARRVVASAVRRDTGAGSEAESLAERGLLTIGESAGFLERGGMINLYEARGRIRFEVNQPAAARAGLVVSSRLPNLAAREP